MCVAWPFASAFICFQKSVHVSYPLSISCKDAHVFLILNSFCFHSQVLLVVEGVPAAAKVGDTIENDV